MLPGAPNQTVFDVAVNPSNALEAIVVIANSGLPKNLVTHDGGVAWAPFTPPAQETGGTFNCSGGPAKVLAFDSVNSNVIYAGSGGAMWVSADGGVSWTPLHLYEDLNLIQPFPGQTGVLVVGGDQGIYMSKDVGTTWSSLNGNLTTSLLNGLSVSGSSILTTVQDFSPTESFDGGSTWQQLSSQNGLPQGENGAALINPGDANYQYVFNGSGFQYSADGGNTFSVSASLPASEFTYSTGGGKSSNMIAVDPTSPSTVYAAAKDGVFRSTDWGISWNLMPWPTSNPSLIVVDPNGTIYVGTAPFPNPGQLYVSHDNGTTWTTSQLPANNSAVPVTLAVDPNNTSLVLLGMSQQPDQPGGGVLLSADGGVTFTPDNQGLPTYSSLSPPIQFYAWSVQFAPASVAHVAAVATGNGIYVSTAGRAWVNISGNAVPQWFTQVVWDSGYLYTSTWGEGVLRAPVSQIIKTKWGF